MIAIRMKQGEVCVFAGFPGFHPGLVELALQAGIAGRGMQPGEAFAERPNGGPRVSDCRRFCGSCRGRCSFRGRDAAQQELRPPDTVSCRKVNAIGRRSPTRQAPYLPRQWSARRLHPNNPLTPHLLQLVHGPPHQGKS
jgi:hypothetical protein